MGKIQSFTVVTRYVQTNGSAGALEGWSLEGEKPRKGEGKGHFASNMKRTEQKQENKKIKEETLYRPKRCNYLHREANVTFVE